jgi:hypothetical protein
VVNPLPSGCELVKRLPVIEVAQEVTFAEFECAGCQLELVTAVKTTPVQAPPVLKDPGVEVVARRLAVDSSQLA